MLLYGDAKVGKSYAALQLSLAISNGTDWLGFPVRQHSRVLYVQLDTPRSLWLARLDALQEAGENVYSTSSPKKPIIYTDREGLGTNSLNILEREDYERLRSVVVRHAPEVVIIDTLKEAHQLSENDATEGQKVVAALTGAAAPAAIVLIHHARKLSADRPNDLRGAARGSSYLVGKMDGIAQLSKSSLHYVGRAIEEGSMRLTRIENGFWVPALNETDAILESILAATPSQREAAQQVAARLGKSEEAARSLIRRYKARKD